MDSEDALSVWDLLMDKGKFFGITPTGLQALDMARIEAGLILSMWIIFHHGTPLLNPGNLLPMS
ncbi:MAG: hypothetical protein CM1200mP10_16610 [Candidatus Neomarinimicrobiota bacterium]|nr:MAG: hypothetical protein CM1200mP10_16610 [Candidatus Neomarinimicrobiota bacterium]